MTEASRIAAETLHVEQVGVGEESSLGASPNMPQKDGQASQQKSFSCPFSDAAGLG